MTNYRPAGFSDEDTDSDDYGFFERPIRTYQPPQNLKKKVENTLQEAIINGSIKDVEGIITEELNNNVNIKLDSGWTPLMHACFHAQEHTVHFLLEKGADPNLHSDSVTPIMAVCSNSSASDDIIYNIVNKLINKDCLLNIGDKYGQTPLMRAISSGRISVVQKLIDIKVNIEMRDQQGWTAVFWSAHHNRPEILKLLIAQGARLTEVDKLNRTPLDIAYSHEYQDIIDILKENTNIADDNELVTHFNNDLRSWHDYYPGIKKGVKPNYSDEIPHLLYGMNCERLTSVIISGGMDLRTFLLINEEHMTQLGIEMPYERQRLRLGLRDFHTRGWKLNAVAGLYARKNENFSVLDCLTTLGTHLQQVYILEATLQYTLRDYAKIQNQIKFEPPDSPLRCKMNTAVKKLLNNINSIRKEMRNMKIILNKISDNNPQPADLIKEKTFKEIALSYATEVVIVCSLGLLIYQNTNIFGTLLKK